jgi:altronate dehydratase
MPALGAELFELTLRTAGGVYSVGERAGHAQVSIWRNWPQAGPTDVSRFTYDDVGGTALRPRAGGPPPAAPVVLAAYPGAAPRGGLAAERVGLVLPTSLCSGEVAKKITDALNEELAGGGGGALRARVTRFVSLPHTEGCGTGYPENGIKTYTRVMLGHLTHPSVATALCLEHGCEKTHNDFFTNSMREAGVPTGRVGFASIQLDGGIEAVTAKVKAYFRGAAEADVGAGAAHGVGARAAGDARALTVGLVVSDKAGAAAAALPELALTAAALARALCAGGGALVLPANSPLLRAPLFTDSLALPAPADADSPAPVAPTLAFGEAVPPGGGVHVMDMPYVKDFSETVTGLAAAGAHAVLLLSTPPRKGTARPAPGHPLVPVVHVGLQAAGSVDPAYAAAADAVLVSPEGRGAAATGEAWAVGALEALAAVASGERPAKAARATFFSITRGPTGVST